MTIFVILAQSFLRFSIFESGRYHCVYCPSDSSIPCTLIPSITNEVACKNAIACELPDGSVEFGLNEDECRFV